MYSIVMKKYAKQLIKDFELNEDNYCPKCIFNSLQLNSQPYNHNVCKIGGNNYFYNGFTCKYESYHKSCRIEKRNNDLLEKCFGKGGLKLYDKWKEILKIDNSNISKLFEYDNNNIDTLESIANYATLHNYDINNDFNYVSQLELPQLSLLVGNGLDINKIYKLDGYYEITLIIKKIHDIIHHCDNILEYNKGIEILNEYIKLGADPLIGNLMREISCILYEDKPYRT